MRYGILVLLLLLSLPLIAFNVSAQQVVSQDTVVLIKNIEMAGFVLGDKSQFVKIFKPYRNKYLTRADMDEILKKVQIIYEEQGYKELVSITYQVNKHRLEFTVLMTS